MADTTLLEQLATQLEQMAADGIKKVEVNPAGTASKLRSSEAEIAALQGQLKGTQEAAAGYLLQLDAYKYTPKAYDVLMERVKELEAEKESLTDRLGAVQQFILRLARDEPREPGAEYVVLKISTDLLVMMAEECGPLPGSASASSDGTGRVYADIPPQERE